MQFEPITSFTGENRFLSNFHSSPVLWLGLTYPTVEHAYQAAKVAPQVLNYAQLTHNIRHATTPGQAKRMGRNAPLRDDWNTVKLEIMRMLIEEKFFHTELRKALMDTAPCEIIEGNTWGDRYWGVSGGYGANHLGCILMDKRKRCMQTYKDTTLAQEERRD